MKFTGKGHSLNNYQAIFPCPKCSTNKDEDKTLIMDHSAHYFVCEKCQFQGKFIYKLKE